MATVRAVRNEIKVKSIAANSLIACGVNETFKPPIHLSETIVIYNLSCNREQLQKTWTHFRSGHPAIFISRVTVFYACIGLSPPIYGFNFIQSDISQQLFSSASLKFLLWFAESMTDQRPATIKPFKTH